MTVRTTAIIALACLWSTTSPGMAQRCVVRAKASAPAIDDPTIAPMRRGDTAVTSSIVIQKDGRVGVCGKFLGCFDAKSIDFATACTLSGAHAEPEQGRMTLDAN